MVFNITRIIQYIFELYSMSVSGILSFTESIQDDQIQAFLLTTDLFERTCTYLNNFVRLEYFRHSHWTELQRKQNANYAGVAHRVLYDVKVGWQSRNCFTQNQVTGRDNKT